MLIAGNDWFTVPVSVPTGMLCQVDALIVHDVFGGTTLVPRADTLDGEAAPSWSMFSTAAAGGVAPFFVMPPSAGPAVQTGPTVEEVRFIRDEMANMVWGIEQTLEGGLGQALPGQERAQAVAAIAAASAPASTVAAALRYLLETLVPENWIPFLPVAIDAALGDIALERAAVDPRPARWRPGSDRAARPHPDAARGRAVSHPRRGGHPCRDARQPRSHALALGRRQHASVDRAS